MAPEDLLKEVACKQIWRAWLGFGYTTEEIAVRALNKLKISEEFRPGDLATERDNQIMKIENKKKRRYYRKRETSPKPSKNVRNSSTTKRKIRKPFVVKNICYDFNLKSCTREKCDYRHICGFCVPDADHPAKSCPKNQN